MPEKRVLISHETEEIPELYFRAIDEDAEKIDLELLHSELKHNSVYTLEDLARLWFSAKYPSMREISVILSSCQKGMPWFKIDNSGRVKVSAPQELDHWKRNEERQTRKDDEIVELQSILNSVLNGDPLPQSIEVCTLARIKATLLDYLLEKNTLEIWPALYEVISKMAGIRHVSYNLFSMKVLEGMDALPADYDIHMRKFYSAFFSSADTEPSDFLPGRSLYPVAPDNDISAIQEAVRQSLKSLPESLNPVTFSLDYEGTEEIDDAISIAPVDEKHLRVGVHIAAPGLFISEESTVHSQAKKQGTTVYQPDLKWTMLPRQIISLFSLKEGSEVPAVSAYFLFSKETFRIEATEFKLEALRTTFNLSYKNIEDNLRGEFIPDLEDSGMNTEKVAFWLKENPRDIPWEISGSLTPEVTSALKYLVPLSRHLFQSRHRSRLPFIRREEYIIKVGENGAIDVIQRKRNGIAEGIVTELMILANSWTAATLTKAGLPAIYRTQMSGVSGFEGRLTRADLTVNPREHQGIGTSFYCWATSPLRRYADLINQRQMGSLIGGSLPVFKDESELLIRAKNSEFQNQTSMTHQRRMNRYWVLKFLEQKSGDTWPVTVNRIKRKVHINFKGLPLELTQPLSFTSVPDGNALFLPERFDFYSLQLDGRLIGQ
ncbi:ribonuclease catalytic domain-containing protein [Acidobacteriota bacterium]